LNPSNFSLRIQSSYFRDIKWGVELPGIFLISKRSHPQIAQTNHDETSLSRLSRDFQLIGLSQLQAGQNARGWAWRFAVVSSGVSWVNGNGLSSGA
jgi:hypothetical protein